MSEKYRMEKDSMGQVKVPAEAMYGAQTQRAVENFPISGIRFPREFVRALALIKAAAAETNADLNELDAKIAKAIAAASREVAKGDWDDQFPIDIFQTGSGTSTNMNANEVIAHRATRILAEKGVDSVVHPNDHVNMGQSSNDVIPTAIHVCLYLQVKNKCLPALRHLADTLAMRAAELNDVVKTGRTHLMDAVPIRMGQEILGWANQIGQAIERIESSLPRLAKLALGGTAVGTGVNAHPEFARRTIEKLAQSTSISFVETELHFSAQASMDAATELSGQLKTTASSLMKIANDLRWMGSGPIAGLGEITLPSLQPGSSIMPGKVNPVICEATMMVCAQIIANDLAVTIGNERGNFQLNVMLPLIAYNSFQSTMLLGNMARVLADKAVKGFTVNQERVAESIEKNPILATALNPKIGYDKAAEIAKKAYKEGLRVKDVAKEMTGLSEAELDDILNPRKMTG